MPIWPPSPNEAGANQLVKRLKALNADIFGTIQAVDGVFSGDIDVTGNLLVTGDIFAGDTSAISTQLDGSSGIIRFSDVLGDGNDPDVKANILPGLATEGGSNRRFDLYLNGALWTGNDLPWVRLTSDNHIDDALIQLGIGALSNGILTVDAAKILMSKQIQSDFGTLAAPAYSFDGDADLGAYRSGANEISHAMGSSARRWIMGAGYLTAQTVTGAARISITAGSASNPSYGFEGDQDTGMYRYTTNGIAWTVSSGRRLSLASDYLRAFDGITAGSAAIRVGGVGDVAAPTYTWVGDANTGMYRIASDTIGFSMGNSLGLVLGGGGNEISARNGHHFIDYAPSTAGAPGSNAMWVNLSGAIYELRRDSSAAVYKTKITDAPELADVPLYPSDFYVEGNHRYGLIADHIARDLPDAAIYKVDTGEVDDYQNRAILAVLAAKANKAEARIGELEAQVEYLMGVVG